MSAPPKAGNSKPTSAKPKYTCRATQLLPLFDLLLPGEPCFLDIEFQKYKIAGENKERHRVSRIGIVNSKGETVLDVYAIYPNEVGGTKCWQQARFGITTKDLTFKNGGAPAHKVEAWVAEIVANRTVVMHGSTHDRTAFYYEKDIWATSTIVDTQDMFGLVKLAELAKKHLDLTILEGLRAPVKDAEATRQLWFLRCSYDREAAAAQPKNTGASKTTTGNHFYHHHHQQQQQQQKGGENMSGSAKKRARNKAAAEAAAVKKPTA